MTTLKAEKRDMSTKAKKLRREGYVTGNVFGREIEGSIPVTLLCAVEISPVLTFCSGRMALIRVDFPTPEWPENKVTFPSNACLISSTPVPSKAEIR